MKEEDLTGLQKDALCEVGTIGAGHAATALSQLVDRKVLITVPKVQIVPLEEMPDLMGGPETIAAAIHHRVFGDLSATTLFVTSIKDTHFLVDMLQNRDLGSTEGLTESDEEMLKQTGNLLVTSYLNALTRFTGFSLLPSQPTFIVDMVGAILGSAVAELGLKVEKAVVIDADFLEIASKIKSRLVFIPSPESLKVILKMIGVK